MRKGDFALAVKKGGSAFFVEIIEEHQTAQDGSEAVRCKDENGDMCIVRVQDIKKVFNSD